MKNDQLRCVDGRLLRHDPQLDDPWLETDRVNVLTAPAKAAAKKEKNPVQKTVGAMTDTNENFTV